MNRTRRPQAIVLCSLGSFTVSKPLGTYECSVFLCWQPYTGYLGCCYVFGRGRSSRSTFSCVYSASRFCSRFAFCLACFRFLLQAVIADKSHLPSPTLPY
ncbi:hypothetical protein HD806DRAFT_43894 [Xylariaceae sp. AK1471]|nr:hypothetical protein HD806DRAFT_43894 [Xylariaceae sp. AK1471]